MVQVHPGPLIWEVGEMVSRGADNALLQVQFLHFLLLKQGTKPVFLRRFIGIKRGNAAQSPCLKFYKIFYIIYIEKIKKKQTSFKRRNVGFYISLCCRRFIIYQKDYEAMKWCGSKLLARVPTWVRFPA